MSSVGASDEPWGYETSPPPVITDEFRLAVRRGVMSGKVAVIWHYAAQMFVADCFYPGCTEGILDSDFLYQYLWATYFKLHGHEPCDMTGLD